MKNNLMKLSNKNYKEVVLPGFAAIIPSKQKLFEDDNGSEFGEHGSRRRSKRQCVRNEGSRTDPGGLL
jgi:hypothetical protein